MDHLLREGERAGRPSAIHGRDPSPTTKTMSKPGSMYIYRVFCVEARHRARKPKSRLLDLTVCRHIVVGSEEACKDRDDTLYVEFF